MTIYATPFDPQTLQCTAPSQDSGLLTLAAAIAAMGPPLSASPQTVVYPGLLFSRIPWRLEP